MKKLTKASLAALSLAAILSTVACGGGSKPSDQPSQAQEQATNKPAGYTDHFPASNGFPSDWNEGAGWQTGSDPKFINLFGNYVTFLEGKTVVVADGKGEKKASFNAPDNMADATLTLRTIYSDDHQYLAVIYNGTEKVDASSVKKTKDPISTVRVLDSDANELWNKNFQSKTGVAEDVIYIAKDDSETPTRALNIETGKEEVVTPPAGSKWAGRFDGVDIFKAESKTNSGSGELSGEGWTYKANTEETSLSTASTKQPKRFGNMLEVERALTATDKKVKCDVIDPHNGKVIDLGKYNELCLTPKVLSADGNFIYFTANTSDSKVIRGIVSLSDKEFFGIGDDIDFTPTAISNDGIVYGKSGDSVAMFDFRKDTEPKKIADATMSPVKLSPSGLAVFDGGYFVVKKQL